MKLFRKVLFWMHLSAGVFAGTVVLIMSVTGVALTYEKQMLVWADLRDYRAEPPADAQRLPLEALLDKARAERGELPTAVVVRPDASDPVGLAFGREATVYTNRYTGELLGEGPAGLRAFFGLMKEWHRWLGASGENRGIGKAITGACNMAFLFIVASGMYLWWPRSLRWANVKSVMLFRGGMRGKARDFNWHNVIGFWSALPLFFVVLGATVISYPWASDLAYRVVGEEPPARRSAAPPAASGRPEARGEVGAIPRADSEGQATDLDRLLARAEERVAGWRTITLRLPQPGEETVSFAIDAGSGGQPQLRSTLTLDRATGAVASWETFDDGTPGRQVRTWLRFIHTGEAGGIVGQTVAGVVSGGAVFLVYTGLALTLRRFLAWIARRRVREEQGVLVET
jgi:uncharacterized iron-regulated membrane protein